MHRLKQFFHKLSIRKKMLTILCLVGMLPVMILGISLGINSYRTVLKYREKDMIISCCCNRHLHYERSRISLVVLI